jgi:hypothetical protein
VGSALRAAGRYALVYALCVVLSVARTLVGGQDLNYDLVTYHYYLGYSAFLDRLPLDYLAASFQGYQSPLPYALWYFLDRAGVYPVFNASIHAAIHALNLIFLFAITELLVRDHGTRWRWAVVACCWLLGAVTPAYWYLVGTSFSDLLASVPVLAGAWLAARACGQGSMHEKAARKWIAAGALLVGAAAGLRMHNAIYVLGLLAAIVALAPRERRLRDLGAAAVAAGAGAVLSFGPWALRLYRELGNPVFPFFNGVFRSPEFPADNLPLTSFVPGSVRDWLEFPFRIGTYRDWVYIEARLPDIRPGLLAILVLIALLLWLLKRTGVLRAATARAGGVGNAVVSSPGARFIFVFFAVSLLLWLGTSSNGRYGIALLLLAGPVCGALVLRMLPVHYLFMVIFGVLVWQAAVLQLFFREARPSSIYWTARYFDWSIPGDLALEPMTVLSFGFQSASTLAPSLHQGSSNINLVGQYVPTVGAPGADRIERIIQSPGRRVVGLFDLEYTRQDVPGAASVKTYFRNHLLLWGLEFDAAPCRFIDLRPPADSMAALNARLGIRPRARPPRMIACDLRPAPAYERAAALEDFAAFRARLADFGKSCPRFFAKPLTYLRTYDRWIVSSFASLEVTLEIPDEGAIVLQMMRPPYVAQVVGQAAKTGLTAPERDCSRWFESLSRFAAETLDAQSRAKP